MLVHVREKWALEKLAIIHSSWAEKKVERENPLFQEKEGSHSH